MPDKVSAQRNSSVADAKGEESASATVRRLRPAPRAAGRPHHGRAGRAPGARAREETAQVGGRLRRREEVALRLIASVLDQCKQLLLGLDTFRGDTQAECVRQ